MTTTSKQKAPLAVRLPAELQDFLTQQAKASYRTLTAEVRMRLEESRDRQLADVQPITPKGTK
ncbi:TraY domain-containing protein [Variovorax sp. UMC13]|uniref:TraY domain-containing protein n=1 Tax=Variovorax sp. UMC13 TaxID=1862326 RepID=UPI001C7F6508